jgi:hypothetical protein
MKRVVFLLSLVAGVMFHGVTASAITVDEGLAAHHAMLARIRTLQFRVTIGTLQRDGQIKRMSQTDVWRSGDSERSIRRSVFTLTPKGLMDVPEAEQVTMLSYDDSQIRTLRGWDPDHPYRLPLDETRSPREFGAVKGTMTPRDPTGGTMGEWSALLLEVYPGKSLAEIAKTAELARLDDSTESRLRIKIVASDLQPLKDAVLELDLTHGALVSKIEFSGTNAVAEVTKYHDLGDGLFLPAEVRRRHGAMATVATCEDPRVNERIPPELLSVTFPPGARVDEAATGKVHLWGTNGPETTFDDPAKFAEYQQAKMRESQQAPFVAVGSRSENSWILWVNLVGIIGLMALILIRRTWTSR